ncbi:MAG: hypothetical protein ACK55S_08930 [Planctomycetota bacterium]
MPIVLTAEQKNAPELPVGRFLKSKSLGGNRVILVVILNKSIQNEPVAYRCLPHHLDFDGL